MTILLRVIIAQCIYIATSLMSDCSDGECTALTTAEKQAILDLHNELRDRVAGGGLSTEGHPAATDMNYLVWDEGLEAVAQTYAESCPGLVHNPDRNFEIKYERDSNPQNTKWGTTNGPTMTASWCESPSWSSTDETCIGIGENLAVRSTSYTLTSILSQIETGWWDEYKVWTFGPSSDGCPDNEQCGHYTQMAWANTRYIGCGYANGCSSGWDSVFVCNYFPMGNMNGATTSPYTEATVATKCSSCMSDRTECNSVYTSRSNTASDYPNQPYNALCDGGMCATMCDGASWSSSTCDGDGCTPLETNTDCTDGTQSLSSGREICSSTNAPTSPTTAPITAAPTTQTNSPTSAAVTPCIILSDHSWSFDGEWDESGTENGETYYMYDGYYLNWLSDYSIWSISNTLGSSSLYRYCENYDLFSCITGTWYYWSSDSSSWTLDSAATLTACPTTTTPEPTEPTEPTTTVAQPNCDYILNIKKKFKNKLSWNETTDADKYITKGLKKLVKKLCVTNTTYDDELEFFYRFKYKDTKDIIIIYMHACCGDYKTFGSAYSVPTDISSYAEYEANEAWIRHNGASLQVNEQWTDIEQFGVKQYVVFSLVALILIGCVVGIIYGITRRNKRKGSIQPDAHSPLPNEAGTIEGDLAATIEMHGASVVSETQNLPFSAINVAETDGDKYEPPQSIVGRKAVPSTSFAAPPLMSSVNATTQEVDNEEQDVTELDL